MGGCFSRAPRTATASPSPSSSVTCHCASSHTVECMTPRESENRDILEGKENLPLFPLLCLPPPVATAPLGQGRPQVPGDGLSPFPFSAWKLPSPSPPLTWVWGQGRPCITKVKGSFPRAAPSGRTGRHCGPLGSLLPPLASCLPPSPLQATHFRNSPSDRLQC